MATGFMPYLLKQARDVFGNATPSKKIRPPGYLEYLLSNGQPKIIGDWIADGSGHIRDVKIKYRTSVPPGKSNTADDCSIDAKPAYKEATVNLTKFRKYSIMFDDLDIAKYEQEASTSVQVGKPATPMMRDVFNAVIESANGLFADINNDLLTLQAAAFGFNQVNHSNAARTINFLQAGSTNDLDTGMTRLYSDIMLNEIRSGDVAIVGSGLINNAYIQNRNGNMSFNQSGLNTLLPPMPQFYFDPYATVGWGANQFGVFERGAVQLVNINRFAGFRGGDKMITKLGTITLPVEDSLGNGELRSFTFDYQWEYNKCPTTGTVGGYADTALDRGWVFTLMATYDQFNIPGDAYVNTDPMFGGNGTLRYVATNV